MNESAKFSTGGKLLAFDTSTASLTTALYDGRRLLGERNTHAERNHSMYLVPSMQELLNELQIGMDDIGAIAVGAGPGSYTGVRIGVSVAKTMAWALGIPVLDVSSLEAMALGGYSEWIAEESGMGGGVASGRSGGTVWIVPLMDARRGQAFTGIYAVSGAHGGSGGQGETGSQSVLGDGFSWNWSCLAADGIRPMDGWIERIAELAGQADAVPRAIVFTGEVAGFQDPIGRFFAEWRGEAAVHEHAIRAYHAARLAYPRWMNGEKSDVHRLVPNYTQLPEAEVKLLAKLKNG